MSEVEEVKIGIVGAGIGGVMAAIAIARAGANVTILEAASQLGEIGAGIQMVRLSLYVELNDYQLMDRRHRTSRGS